MKHIQIILLGAAIALAAWARAQTTQPLRLVQTIPMPNVAGRIDHLAVDVKGGRLFVAALGNNTVEVIDLRAGRQVRSIPDFSKPQGVFYVPRLKKLFVAGGNDGTCKIFRGDTLGLITSVKLALGADLMDYDAAAKRLYVGYGGKDAGQDYGEVGILDATKGTHLGDIKMDAHPGSILVEKTGPRLFVSVPEINQVAVVERKSGAVIAKWPVTDAKQPVSLALDEAGRRLFVGTRNPPRVIALDAESGKAVASLPSVGVIDGMFWDGERKRIYVSGGEGFVDVYQQRDADHYDSVASIPTRSIARTSLFVPELKRLYVAVPRNEQENAEIRVYEAQP